MKTTKILNIPLSDLSTIRLTCKKCRATVELATRQHGALLKNGMCRFCGEILWDDSTTSANPLLELRSALLGLEKWSDVLDVEFTIPDAAASGP